MSAESILLIDARIALRRCPDHNMNQAHTLTRAVRKSLSTDSHHSAETEMPISRVSRVFPHQKRNEEPFQWDALLGQHPDPVQASHAIPTLQEVWPPGNLCILKNRQYTSEQFRLGRYLRRRKENFQRCFKASQLYIQFNFDPLESAASFT